MKPLVSVSSVGKVYQQPSGQVRALNDFTTRVQEGEIVSVLGPSGCGKTTLLRIIAGIVGPSTGSVTLDGRRPEDYRRSDGIGFVFQKPLLFPWRTVLDNVLLPAEVGPAARGRNQYRQRAEYLLLLMGLSGFERTHPNQLSGGMLQRAAVARALLNQPKLLLLDEPFSALDELTREQIWFDFARMWRQEVSTVVLVTHSIREAVFMGDRVVVMSPRPGTVRAEVEIGMPKGRDRSTMANPEFINLCESVRSKLE